jgi:PAS domain S-box-containing protein
VNTKSEVPVKILLVDDRPENLLALEVMLEKTNYQLVKATSGKEALMILLKEQDFALILMDALMPVMDGFETAAMIRQSQKLKYVPIIFLTAQMNAPDEVFKGYQAGAVDYMLKPIAAEILKAKVAVFVDLYKKNNELMVQKAELRLKMNQLAESQWLAHIGSWEWDIPSDRIEWSDELFRIFGLGPQELKPTYEKFLKFIHPDDRNNVDAIIQQAKKDHLPFNFFHKVVRDDNETRIVNSIGKVMIDGGGKILKMTSSVQDITEQKQAEEKALKLIEEKNIAQREKEVAEESAKSKQRFLSNMSHEIRTPLNSIIGFTNVVLKTELSEKQKEYLNAIKLSSDSLIVLINDILDLAKVDAGKMTFEKTPFRLCESIDSVLYLFETKLSEKNLELVKQFDPAIPKVLVGDPVRLHQIIMNLVSNAIKFTNEGKITVAAKLIDQTNDSAIIETSVSDTGIGIPSAKIKTVFSAFQQATTDTTRLYGGTGLGLAIVKQLVKAQGGEISVESEEGKGTTFRFNLPFGKTDGDVRDKNADHHITEEKVGNIKVLVAEDIKFNQLLMKTLLEGFGFDLEIAENGKIAVEKLQNGHFDLVLMDLQMPVMDGFTATEHMRNDLHSDVPIIALTADVTTVDVEKCKQAGMDDYISKPVDEKVLYNKIVKYVKKKTV